VLWLFAAGLALPLTLPAGPYSQALADDANPFDAPVPAFTGPEGDGLAPDFGFTDNRPNPVFLAWADTQADYSPASGGLFIAPATGEATGSEFHVATLGELTATQIANGDEPGSLTLSFAEPVFDAPGADFAVFENGFIAQSDFGGAGIGGIAGELAYVEVSSNGVNFVRFPAISGTPGALGSFGTLDATVLYNLAGKHVNHDGKSWGTPFDLSELSGEALVTDGLVDLDAIRFVRLVDIPGSGDFLDSLGGPIYDPWPTWTPEMGSAATSGADIEAVGAVSQVYTLAAWQARSGVSGAPGSDTDGDGASDRAEYAAGTSANDPADTPRLRVLPDAAAGTVRLGYPRDVRTSTGTVYVQRAPHPGGPWETLAELGPLGTAAAVAGDVAAITSASRHKQASLGVLREYFVEVPLAGAGADFYRVRVETP